MSSRTSSALGILTLLAACASESPPPPGDKVECAIGAGAELSAVCSLERVAGQDSFVLHHPDGGFRRLTHDRATGGLAPMDGAEPVRMQSRRADALEFGIGEDRYRVPLSLLAQAPQ